MITRKQRAELNALILKRCQMTAEYTWAEALKEKSPMAMYKKEVEQATEALTEFLDGISPPAIPEHIKACAKHYLEMEYADEDLYCNYKYFFGDDFVAAVEELQCSTKNS